VGRPNKYNHLHVNADKLKLIVEMGSNLNPNKTKKTRTSFLKNQTALLGELEKRNP